MDKCIGPTKFYKLCISETGASDGMSTSVTQYMIILNGEPAKKIIFLR